MRTVLAGAAAAWFIIQAFTFLPYGAYANDGAPGGIDGDPGAVAVTWAARALFAGLALVALALVEWTAVMAWSRSAGRPPKDRTNPIWKSPDRDAPTEPESPVPRG